MANSEFFIQFETYGLSGPALQQARLKFEEIVDSVVTEKVDLGLMALAAYKSLVFDFPESYVKATQAFNQHFDTLLESCSVDGLAWAWWFVKYNKDEYRGEGMNHHSHRLVQITAEVKTRNLTRDDKRLVESCLRHYIKRWGCFSDWTRTSLWQAVLHKERQADAAKRAEQERLAAEKLRQEEELRAARLRQQQEEEAAREAEKRDQGQKGIAFRHHFDDLMKMGQHDEAIKLIFNNWQVMDWYYLYSIERVGFNREGLWEIVTQIGNVVDTLSLDSLQLLVDYICPPLDGDWVPSHIMRYHDDKDEGKHLHEDLLFRMTCRLDIFNFHALLHRFVQLAEEAGDLDRLQRHYDAFIRKEWFDKTGFVPYEPKDTYYGRHDAAHQSYRQRVIEAIYRLARK